MDGFFGSIWASLKALPGTLRDGLRPGTGGEHDAPARRIRRNFIYHLHPAQVTDVALKPSTTLGLGVITLTLFFLLSVSGILLMIYYVPTVRGAYASMQDIEYAVTFGSFIRALHRWSAHAMVVCVLVHLVRVAATGGYHRRLLNWLLGLALLLLTLGLAFTGYLLPWDQRSFWAVSVAANMLDNLPLLGGWVKELFLGGAGVGQATLLRFYTLHVALLPAALVVLAALHLWRIRKDGGLVASGAASTRVPAWPHLVLREALLVLVVTSAVCLVATLVEAPLGAAVDPYVPDNPEKAPWFFLGLQEMVSYSAPIGTVIFPGVFLLGLVGLPLLERGEAGTGRWLGTGRCRWAVAITSVAAIALFVVFMAAQLGRAPGLPSDWLNPASGMIALAACALAVAGMVTGSVRAGLLAGLAVMLVALAGFTVVGICRGPDWVFYWPWEEWPLAY